MPIFRGTDFELAGGVVLPILEIAYECYGTMSADKSNVILVAHGITSSHHAAGAPTADRRRGWWSEVIGPEKLFDTQRYCVISSNTLGSCYGSTGPASVNPATGERYGISFPTLSLEDVAESAYQVIRRLGIERLHTVIGCSMGGITGLALCVKHPEAVAGFIAPKC